MGGIKKGGGYKKATVGKRATVKRAAPKAAPKPAPKKAAPKKESAPSKSAGERKLERKGKASNRKETKAAGLREKSSTATGRDKVKLNRKASKKERAAIRKDINTAGLDTGSRGKKKIIKADRKRSKGQDIYSRAKDKEGFKGREKKIKQKAFRKETAAARKEGTETFGSGGGKNSRKARKSINKTAKADKYKSKVAELGKNADGTSRELTKKEKRQKKRWDRKAEKKLKKADKKAKKTDLGTSGADLKKQVDDRQQGHWNKIDKRTDERRDGAQPKIKSHSKHSKNFSGQSYINYDKGKTEGAGAGANGVSADQNSFTKPNPAAQKPLGGKFKVFANAADENNPYSSKSKFAG